MATNCKLLVKQKYISVGCNRTPLCLDWGFNGLVAFGAYNSIALYQPGVSIKKSKTSLKVVCCQKLGEQGTV